eukprot:6365600-Pyramimonas_sp.AAC.1
MHSTPQRPFLREYYYNIKRLLLHFTGPPVPITARMHSTPQRPFLREYYYIWGVECIWGVERILAVIGTGGPVKRSNIM